MDSKDDQAMKTNCVAILDSSNGKSFPIQYSAQSIDDTRFEWKFQGCILN